MKLTPSHPALSERRTIHPKRRFKPDPKKLFKLASANTKLGNGNSIIQKGDWRGLPLYSLTLEERATCPNTCIHWDDCYGNRMAFAHRFEHGEELEKAIPIALETLSKKHKKGFAVRLHVLGDFYSQKYVFLWGSMLAKFPNMRVYGYTAHPQDSKIGNTVKLVRSVFQGRFQIRYSTNDTTDSRYIASNTPILGGIVCPEQVGKTESCLTCGLCWAFSGPIQFLTHKKKKEHATVT